MSWFGQIVKWIVGDEVNARFKAYRSMSKVYVGTPRNQEGDDFGNMVGGEVGGVAWPVDPTQHDGLAFLASASFVSFYIHGAKEVRMVDEPAPQAAGSSIMPLFHPGAAALVVGTNVHLAQDYGRDMLGITVRTAKFGTDGLYRNVFFGLKDGHIPNSIAIVAHHLDPFPNIASTPVYDPREGTGSVPTLGGQGNPGTTIRKAFTDDQWRVGGFNNQWRAYRSECPGKSVVKPTFPPDDGKKGGLYWNLGSSGVDPYRGHGMAWFDGAGKDRGNCAYLGYGFNGPLRPASELHKLAEHATGDMRSGALDLNTYWTWGSSGADAPLDFEQLEEPDVKDDAGIPTRVHLMIDNGVCHPHIAGPRPGKWRWHVKIPEVKLPQCTPTIPGEDPIQYRFDMGGRMPSPTYYLGFKIGAGEIGLPAPGIHLRAG